MFFVGVAIGIVGLIWLAAMVFNENLLLGLVCLVIPALLLFWGFTHWELAKKPTSILVTGILIVLFSLTR